MLEKAPLLPAPRLTKGTEMYLLLLNSPILPFESPPILIFASAVDRVVEGKGLMLWM